MFHFKRRHQVMRMVDNNCQKKLQQPRPVLNKRLLLNQIINNRTRQEVYQIQLMVSLEQSLEKFKRMHITEQVLSQITLNTQSLILKITFNTVLEQQLKTLHMLQSKQRKKHRIQVLPILQKAQVLDQHYKPPQRKQVMALIISERKDIKVFQLSVHMLRKAHQLEKLLKQLLRLRLKRQLCFREQVTPCLARYKPFPEQLPLK